MASRSQFIRYLCAALINGPWQRSAMQQRCEQLLDDSPRWLPVLLDALLSRFTDHSAPSPAPLQRYIAGLAIFDTAWADRERRPVLRQLPLSPPRQQAPPPYLLQAIPELPNSSSIAEWLGLSTGELDWFADSQGRQRRIADGPLRHYRYRWIAKRHGPPRLLEVPKQRLKAIQRRLLREILDAVPPHPVAHGFRNGHNCRSFAQPHCGRQLLLRIDLQDFFPSIRASRIHALFRQLGYPWKSARLLTGLCCNAVGTDIRSPADLPQPDWASRQRLAFPHLPQGAPTSPALANLAAQQLDRRLSGLAARHQLHYTRYADDLAFSGDRVSPRRAHHLAALVAAIAADEGFAVNHRKTRLMRASSAQRLTGISVNQHPNIPRADYDQLKATLFNCVRHGPASQNHQQHPDYRAHLRGRIAHVRQLNPARAEKLQRLFDTIPWPVSPVPPDLPGQPSPP